MLPLREAFLELAGTIRNASLCYDVWWELQNAENQDKYCEIVEKHFAFFEANAGAQLVAMIVLLYQAYEKREDTQNFHNLVTLLESEAEAKILAKQLRREIYDVTPIWKKVARARSTVIAHLSHQKTSAQLMQDADLSPNEIRDLICASKSMLGRIGSAFGVLGTAGLEMSAIGDTRRLMQALGADIEVLS